MRRIRHLCGQRNLHFAALCALVFALATFANAQGHAHKGKQGHLNIKAPTEISGTVLQPGSYRVREADSSEGTMVEFVRETYDFFAPDGSSPYDEEVVARIRASEQALDVRSKHTQLEFGPEAGRAVALEVKGERAKYLFEPASEANTPGAMAGQAERSQ